jgi:hypothetical protein
LVFSIERRMIENGNSTIPSLRIQFLGILIQNERIVSHPNKAEGTP